MKNFFTSFLGALTALFAFSILAIFILLILVAAIGFAVRNGNQKEVVIEKGSYVVFDMSVNLTDAPEQFDTSMLAATLTGGGDMPKRVQVRQVTKALQAIANDNRIAGVFVHGHFAPSDLGSGYAALNEVRNAITTVRASGKRVVFYLEDAGLREMYLASAADEIVLDPYGMILMPGLAARPMFIAGTLGKLGVGIQVTRVGKYKSAIEPLTRTDMSPESREQEQKLLDDIWNYMLASIAKERGTEAGALQGLLDREGVIAPESALQNKLVTRVAYRDEVLKDLKTRTGQTEAAKAFKQVSLADYASTVRMTSGPAPRSDSKTSNATAQTAAKNANSNDKKPRGTVAIVYAEGTIVDGRGDSSQIGGETLSRQIRSLREDNTVKAIVLRVNSPGGSATASEHIQREIRLAKQAKPVIVSMGSYATSGGYWISTYADRIFAEPATITGSIGVFGVFVDVQKLASSIGVTFDTVKTGKYADSMTITRPKTPEEMVIMQKLIDWIYDQFLNKVSQSRGMARERVAEIAQGRVWSGTEALHLGLVDELGGLDDALAYAVQKAGLSEDYRVSEYPKKKEFGDMLREILGKVTPNEAATRVAGRGVLDEMLGQFRAEAAALNEFNDPRGIYLRLPRELMVR